MSLISKVTLPSGSGGYDLRASAISSGVVDSTSTSTAFTATVPGITELTEGVCVFLRNGVVTSAENFTLNVNGLGAKPCYNNLATGNEGTSTAATRDTTIFNINYTMLFVYTELIYNVSGGAWICYRGYDANTNTIGYQLRTNSGNLEASDTGYKYRLWFTSADGKQWVPANTSTSTNATTARTMNTRPINPFGPIVYNSTNGTTNANARPTAANLWQQYTLTIGYSYVVSLTAYDPVYVQCTPQTDGSAVMNAIVKALPTSNDGKIYIYLGIAYSTTAMELRTEHPVFYHDGNGIKFWTGTKIPTKTSDLTNDSNFITDASYVHTDNNYTTTEKNKLSGIAEGAEVNQNAFSNVKVGSTTVAADGKTDTLELVAGSNITLTPDATNDKVTIAATVPTKVSDLTNDSGFITTWPTWYGICQSAAETSTKVVTVFDSNFTLDDGNVIFVWFQAGNSVTSGTVTMNVNNTGACEVRTRTESTDIHLPSLAGGEVAAFMWKSSYWVLIGGVTSSTLQDLQVTVNGKQATLVSGTNIKTINGTSILGSGNITTPDNNSTYSLTQNSSDGHKLIWTANGGTPSTFTIPDNNTTYDLSTIAGTLSVAKGGTGATNAAGARTNLQAASTAVATTAANGLMSTADKQYLSSTLPGIIPIYAGLVGTSTSSGYQIDTWFSDGENNELTLLGDNVTIPKASTASFGVVKPNGTSTHYLNGTGGWTAPLNATYTLTGTTSTSDYKVVLSGANAATATIPLATTAKAGLIKPDGSTAHVLNGKGQWVSPPVEVTGFTYISENSSGGVILNNQNNLVENYAVAEGNGTTASYGAHAQGYLTKALGNYSHSEGQETQVAVGAPLGHAEGFMTNVLEYAAHAEGGMSTASERYSHAEGSLTLASAIYSHAEGDTTTASGAQAHAQGYHTLASTVSAHAEGDHTVASGNQSHAQGNQTTASGSQSHAGGYKTLASGNHSFATGIGTIAFNEAQTVVGKYNDTTLADLGDDTLFVVGNGYQPSEGDISLGSNAFEVHSDGRATAGANATASDGLLRYGQVARYSTSFPAAVTCSNGSNTTLASTAIGVKGIILINFHAGFPSSTTGIRRIYLTNSSSGTHSSPIDRTCVISSGGGADVRLGGFAIINTTTATVPYNVYFRAYQNSGGSMSVTPGFKTLVIKQL